ncbi:MAG: LPS export ABC transporter periplasmic protein LptC [Nitrospira sp.]|nr:LPS export ABC transporter periplasmic protein LptC [Nitrospira sp.]
MPYRWVIILILCLFVFIVILFKGKHVKKGDGLDTVSLGSLSQNINDFHLFRLNGKEIEMEILAKKAIVSSEEDDALISDIKITYNPQGSRPIQLYADKGKYNINKNILLVEKEDKVVDIKIGRNVSIKANSFQWMEDRKEIQSPGKVYISGDNFSLEGEVLVADINNGVYEIKKNIKATMW